ncbi:hypothetical protein QYE76_040759 [Lolium multiflorum]|uniref:Uncharacterized protein n=1 Tax=Lolium multiflorum TaxID=4521 RepID=A0AAD8TCH1_LOLMU|nr:hypothetical protein QYE76_040759 [Lolium multiflorum]
MTAMATRCRCNLSCYLAAALLLLLAAFLNAPLTAAQPLPWQLCGNNTGNYTEGSAYQANIRVLATVFPTNASASPALFTKGSAGTAPSTRSLPRRHQRLLLQGLRRRRLPERAAALRFQQVLYQGSNGSIVACPRSTSLPRQQRSLTRS